MKKYLIFIMMVLCFTNCANKIKPDKEERGWNDFSNLNLKLKGVVSSVNNDVNGGSFHGRGITEVKILKSNLKFYDPRDKQMNYYCIIKGSKAELYDNHVNHTDVGDTIEIDTNKKTIKWINTIKSKQIFSLSIGEVSFFEYIKKENLQKL